MNREQDTKRLTENIKKLSQENRRLKQLCERDFLTGLFNRRKFEEDLWRYMDIHRRHRIKFSILLIDIDNFKRINDTKGHIIGDKVLRNVAYMLQSVVRTYDKVYRLAGDEFVIICSHHKSTKELMQRIHSSLAKINTIVSIGHCNIQHKYCKDILEMLDKKMYEEKRKKC